MNILIISCDKKNRFTTFGLFCYKKWMRRVKRKKLVSQKFNSSAYKNILSWYKRKCFTINQRVKKNNSFCSISHCWLGRAIIFGHQISLSLVLQYYTLVKSQQVLCRRWRSTHRYRFIVSVVKRAARSIEGDLAFSLSRVKSSAERQACE